MTDMLTRLRATLADRYLIEREIGMGGMARVYLAEDSRHRRKVAIKVLEPEIAAALGRERFLREIEVVAGLRHPHIVPLHDSGVADGLLYYVMPYVEGETLRERLEREPQLPVEEALAITREVADGLHYAHGRGVVHRDVKPGNILLEAGHAVIADFGIARAVSEAGGDRLTRTGHSVGTPAYMSPEQGLAEREVDARSDVYSLACVAYEMLAGHAPYAGSTAQAVLARKSMERPPGLRPVRDAVPEHVEDAILRALSPSPADRFGSTADFVAALEEGLTAYREPRRQVMLWSAGIVLVAAVTIGVAIVRLGPANGRDGPASEEAGRAQHSLAVLVPNDQTSATERVEWFADGMHDALVTSLQKVGAFRVTPRRSVLSYREGMLSAREIAEELGVDLIVAPEVLLVGGEARISVYLIDGATDAQLFAEAYQRPLEDILSLQGDVAQAIAGDLNVVLTPAEERRLGSTRAVDQDAYASYVLGLRHLHLSTPEHFEASVRLFTDATRRDSTLVEAWAALATTYTVTLFFGRHLMPPAEAGLLAERAASHALAIDNETAEAHVAMAVVEWFTRRDFDAAEWSFRKALALNPSSVLGLQMYARFLGSVNWRYAEAISAMERGVSLDPLSAELRGELALYLAYAGAVDGAADEARLAMKIDSLHPLPHLALSLEGRIRQEWNAALREMDELERLQGAAQGYQEFRAATLAHLGRIEEAREILQGVERLLERCETYPGAAAWIYAALGEQENALRSIEEAALRCPAPPVSPDYWASLPLHSEPRFLAVLDQWGFRSPPSPNELLP